MGSLGEVPVDTLNNTPEFHYKQIFTGPDVFLHTFLYLHGAVDPYNIESLTKKDLQIIQKLWQDLPEAAKIQAYECKSIKQLLDLMKAGTQQIL